MPYMVQQLIEGHPRPVAVSSDDAALVALRLMIVHNFSQLPVVESDGRPSGMVTGARDTARA